MIALLLALILLSGCAHTEIAPEQPLPEEVRVGITQLILERDLWHRHADQLRDLLKAHREATSCFIWEARTEGFWR
jgi:hypothetical protein